MRGKGSGELTPIKWRMLTFPERQESADHPNGRNRVTFHEAYLTRQDAEVFSPLAQKANVQIRPLPARYSE